ncbi:hypothetical protein [Coralloluteibacterium thermophilus]|uniref:Efflux transporter periplasmic adaptor subunit n=1 Tax=Coralloluteibacterium thermophilum TaxID=2707049 RepID=A0ABV9NS10_9GAMM
MTGRTHARFSVSLILGLIVAVVVGIGVHQLRQTPLAASGGLLSEPAAGGGQGAGNPPRGSAVPAKAAAVE